MANESDKFQSFSKLAEGEEAHQFIQLTDVAQHLNIDPHRVVGVALLLKEEMGGLHGQVIWLRGIPWFSCVFIAAMEARLKAAIENVGKAVESAKASGN